MCLPLFYYYKILDSRKFFLISNLYENWSPHYCPMIIKDPAVIHLLSLYLGKNRDKNSHINKKVPFITWDTLLNQGQDITIIMRIKKENFISKNVKYLFRFSLSITLNTPWFIQSYTQTQNNHLIGPPFESNFV